jgi:hypothetical protein
VAQIHVSTHVLSVTYPTSCHAQRNIDNDWATLALCRRQKCMSCGWCLAQGSATPATINEKTRTGEIDLALQRAKELKP